MKIAFAVNWRGGRESGVYHKVVSQVRTWCSLGHEVGVFATTTRAAAEDWAKLDQTFALFEARPNPLGRLVARERAAAAVREWAPDIVYTRHGVAYPGLVRLARQYPLIIEINGDDLAESAHRFMAIRLAIRMTRMFTLRSASGLAFVTHELAARASFSDFKKPGIVVANGIDLETVKPAEPTTRAVASRMVFLGHPGTAWHGVDELLELAHCLPDWEVHIVGPRADDFAESAPANVRFHGLLDAGAYGELLRSADVAIGSLAMYRAGIQEGSPLKVREYLAAGIPTVIAYDDTDFPAGADFLLRLPNAPGNAASAAPAISAFADRWRGRRVPRQDVLHLDVVQKEKIRLAFLGTFLPAGRDS